MQYSNTVHRAKVNSSFLVIEDSLFDQRRIERILKRHFIGVEIQYASTLKAAHKILGKMRFSLILLDNNLPDGRGADYVQTLAADSNLASIPVIIISDWPSPFMWEKAESAGVRYVLKKDEFHAGHVQSALANNNRANIGAQSSTRSHHR